MRKVTPIDIKRRRAARIRRHFEEAQRAQIKRTQRAVLGLAAGLAGACWFLWWVLG